jgi:hypothetical protein
MVKHPGQLTQISKNTGPMVRIILHKNTSQVDYAGIDRS